MKKFTFTFLTLTVALLFSFKLSAQTVIYSDNFESYAANAYIVASNPTNWATWSSPYTVAEDARVSTEFASSPTKSIKIDGNSDILWKLGNKTTGKYIVSWKMYIPSNFGGYYNFQHFQAPGVEFAFEVYFPINGNGYVHAVTQNAATFTYQPNTWLNISHDINLDTDQIKMYINNVLIHTWKFSAQSNAPNGTKQLGAVNIYAGAPTGQTAKYYVDDVSYTENNLTYLYQDNFEPYALNAFIAVSKPEFWATWTGPTGTAEDGRIVDTQSSSPTKSLKVDGAVDLIMKLGNKTTGKYQVNWKMFVPTGTAGYYNFQHFQAPGVEWAMEAYFPTNGQGYLHAGGNNAATFTFTPNTWLTLRHEIDLEKDSIRMLLNNVQVYRWKYSLLAQGGPGTKQLGSVNFYAGAPTGQTPRYFVDDVEYISVVQGATNPAIQVSNANILQTINSGTNTTQILPIKNNGGLPLNVNIVPSFDLPTLKQAVAPLVPYDKTPKVAGEFVADPNAIPGGAAPIDRNITLSYDGENNTGIGYNNAVQWRAAARFPAAMVRPHNGMFVSQVLIYINDPANAHKVQIYTMGSINLPGPGALLYEQAFNPLPGWNTINLTNPVYVDGRDLWVGYWMDQPAGIFPAGADAGPAHADGRWTSAGPGWNLLTLDRNWNIKAKLTGTARPVWLSTNPAQLTIAAGATTNVTVGINAAGLNPAVSYRGKLHVRSNDPTNEQVNINVWLTVLVGLNEAGEQSYVSAYPNPANSVLNLKANTTINRVIISNALGQIVYDNMLNKSETSIDVSALKTGMYFIRMETANGAATQKLMID